MKQPVDKLFIYLMKLKITMAVDQKNLLLHCNVQIKKEKDRITIATIDIGGGTTDLVINDYSLDYGENGGSGSNAYIIPTQRFRDGFKVAGDDILLDMIRNVVVESLTVGLKNAGLRDPEPILSELIGDQALKVQDALLRQQLTLQVFSPIGLRVLKEYESYDPMQRPMH